MNFWALSTGQLSSARFLARRLKYHTDPVSVFIYRRLREVTRTQLEKWPLSGEVPATLKRLLARDLNVIICKRSIWDEARFANINLREETRELIQLRQKDQYGFCRLNRFLLEDALPVALPRIFPCRRSGVVIYWGRGFKPVPSQYGFIAPFFISAGIHYFDEGRLGQDEKCCSTRQMVGRLVKFQVRGSLDPSAYDVHLKAPFPKSLVSAWEPHIGKIVKISDNPFRVVIETLEGIKAECNNVSGCPSGRSFLKVGTLIRCRTFRWIDRGMVQAFDIAPIDPSEPLEHARMVAHSGKDKNGAGPIVAKGAPQHVGSPNLENLQHAKGELRIGLTEAKESEMQHLREAQTKAAESSLPEFEVKSSTSTQGRSRSSPRRTTQGEDMIRNGLRFDPGTGDLVLPGSRRIPLPPRACT